MRTLSIETPIGTYPVILGDGVIEHLLDFIEGQPLLIITDERVSILHLDVLLARLNEYNVSVFTLSEHPERDKNLSKYEELITYALSIGFPRKGNVIAFGGGAVGDFAGYFAATYMRGVDYIQVPTTLLAHDSSVGGKVAVNHDGVKNVVGCFYAPKAVLFDLTFLKTLPEEEIYSGCGELIKHDLLGDGTFIDQLKALNHLSDLYHNDLEGLLEKAILTKYDYIKDDVYDTSGKRKYLNLGHTLGHAIEGIYGIRHGIAILYGLCYSTYLLNEDDGLEWFRLFSRLGFFQSLPKIDANRLLDVMVHDKKNRNDQELHFIGLKQIGEPVSIYLTPSDFISTFQQFLARTEC